MSDKKYHLKITDNENNRVIYDIDTPHIMGTFSRGFCDNSVISLVGGISTVEYCVTLLALEAAIEKLYKQYPELEEGVQKLKAEYKVDLMDAEEFTDLK